MFPCLLLCYKTTFSYFLFLKESAVAPCFFFCYSYLAEYRTQFDSDVSIYRICYIMCFLTYVCMLMCHTLIVMDSDVLLSSLQLIKQSGKQMKRMMVMMLTFPWRMKRSSLHFKARELATDLNGRPRRFHRHIYACTYI